ncbi:hypothetical protein SAMN05444278_10434 [Psychroflexus salarius]|uniref:Uncharacterized protein n=1 Tax=Psychroflexus salarius TaxID=1155689 RepID=A0A1M4VFK7_9FLAO|nr:hypothetical protein [Psychroflexus salarius]SHE67698.1 hypothetical protein SAMN05444278_10434 [Psychroflexus salarius]
MQIYYPRKRFRGLALVCLGLLFVATVNLTSELLIFQIVGALILILVVLLGFTLLSILASKFRLLTLTETEFIDYRVLNSPINLSDIRGFSIDNQSLQLQLKPTAQLEFKTFHRLFLHLFYKDHQLKLNTSILSASQIKLLKHQLKSNCSSSSL